MKLFLILLIFFGACGTSNSADSSITNLYLETGLSSPNNHDYYTAIQANINNLDLELGYGENHNQYDLINLDTTSVQLTVGKNLHENFHLAAGYSSWGQAGEINIDTFRFEIITNTLDWSFVASPQTRHIKLHTLLVSQPIVTARSSGLSLGASYYRLAPWTFYLNYNRHTYSRDLSALSSDPRLTLVFSPSAFSHAYGFEESRVSGSLSYDTYWGTIDLQLARSISAVDSSVLRSIALNINYVTSEHWMIILRAGFSKNKLTNSQATFGSVGLNYIF